MKTYALILVISLISATYLVRGLSSAVRAATDQVASHIAQPQPH